MEVFAVPQAPEAPPGPDEHVTGRQFEQRIGRVGNGVEAIALEPCDRRLRPDDSGLARRDPTYVAFVEEQAAHVALREQHLGVAPEGHARRPAAVRRVQPRERADEHLTPGRGRQCIDEREIAAHGADAPVLEAMHGLCVTGPERAVDGEERARLTGPARARGERAAVDALEPRGRRDPDRAEVVLRDRPDAIEGTAVGTGHGHRRIAVETVEATVGGTDPHAPDGVLEHDLHVRWRRAGIQSIEGTVGADEAIDTAAPGADEHGAVGGCEHLARGGVRQRARIVGVVQEGVNFVAVEDVRATGCRAEPDAADGVLNHAEDGRVGEAVGEREGLELDRIGERGQCPAEHPGGKPYTNGANLRTHARSPDRCAQSSPAARRRPSGSS